jgi:hypothetical protein
MCWCFVGERDYSFFGRITTNTLHLWRGGSGGAAPPCLRVLSAELCVRTLKWNMWLIKLRRLTPIRSVLNFLLEGSQESLRLETNLKASPSSVQTTNMASPKWRLCYYGLWILRQRGDDSLRGFWILKALHQLRFTENHWYVIET